MLGVIVALKPEPTHGRSGRSPPMTSRGRRSGRASARIPWRCRRWV